jgi:hypothetical protein
VVLGRLAILWSYVLELWVGAISRRANYLHASILVGKCKMSNAKMMFEMDSSGHGSHKRRTLG